MALRRRAVWLATVGAGVGLVAVIALWLQVDRGNSESAQARPVTEGATTDDEWIALIQKAKRDIGDPNAPWPEPQYPPGTKIVRDCAGVPPPDIRPLGGWFGYSPDGTRRQAMFSYRGFIVMLRSDQDLSGCSEAMVRQLRGPDPWKENVDKHICEQMRIMAQGQPKTDVTLRDASPRVARAYLEAFCQEPPPTAMPTATPGGP